jgi:hypothetical protein
MKFKSHPYYDNSDAKDWLFLRPDHWGELDPGPEKALQDLLRNDKQWLCELALCRIREMAGASYIAERPYPDVNEFMFYPIGEQGYKVYVEYFFFEKPDKNSPYSDFWWVIISCPYTIPPFPTGRREAGVVGLGWVDP